MEESQFVHDREIITVCCEINIKHINLLMLNLLRYKVTTSFLILPRFTKLCKIFLVKLNTKFLSFCVICTHKDGYPCSRGMCYLHIQCQLQEFKLNLHQRENVVFAPTKPMGNERGLCYWFC